MTETEKKLCRYYNTSGGCWYGDKCHFWHVTDTRPICKFIATSNGCKFGENCYFSHDTHSLDNAKYFKEMYYADNKEEIKESPSPVEILGTNNNSMELQNANAKVFLNENDISEGKLNNNEIQCGSCKHKIERVGDESYCNLMKKHYLDCFMEKEPEHIKCVMILSSSKAGQLYWCKTCYLVFDKLWSLFQHVVDKVQNMRTQVWDKRAHSDWLDNVSSLMAGFDLGLFTPLKLRLDLRTLFTDQSSNPEEDKGSNNPNPWTNPNTIPWRVQQRQMMRKIENLNRHMFRRGGGNSRNFIPSNGPKGHRGRGGGYHNNSNNRNYSGNNSFDTSNASIQSQASGDNVVDYNCGFTQEEVEELLAQGIKPWDEEAFLALQVLHGELDYLLQ